MTDEIKTDRKVLTADEARKLMRCDSDAGRLFWLPRPPELFRTKRDCNVWNARFSCAEAFTAIDRHGYYHGRIHRKLYMAHRVIWLIETGEWPAEDIDHINGVRSDNRMSNLRAVSRSENSRNSRRRTDNSSGATGVSWAKRERKWFAAIYTSGRTTRLGYFDTLEDAIAARIAANKLYGFSDRHGSDGMTDSLDFPARTCAVLRAIKGEREAGQ